MFYGHLQPFTIDGCENITLKNLVIDWEKPLVSEGEIVGRSADFIDVRINQNLFPCRVRDYSMYFDIGDGEESELTYGDHTIYNPDTLKVTPRSSDIVKVKSVEALSDDTFRLYTRMIYAAWLSAARRGSYRPQTQQAYTFRYFRGEQHRNHL